MKKEQFKKLYDAWKLRYKEYDEENDPYSIGYKDALNECILDLQEILYPIEDIFKDFKSSDITFYLESQAADDYLSSLEAHEPEP